MVKNYQRLEQLYNVLVYCTAKRVFSIGERICINQERAKLMREQSETENPQKLFAKDFGHSKKLTAKIDFIIMKINHEKELKNGN